MPLKVSDGMGSWIKDFKTSDAPQFAGKSTKDRRDMAIAAYLSKKNEETQVDEISAKLAGRYIKKRTHRDIPYAGQQMGSQHKQRRHQGVKDFVKHTKSVDMAVDKLTKNKDKIKVPATEAKRVVHSDKPDSLKSVKIITPKTKKEANVNEISKDLAAKYIKKRADDLPHAGYMMNDPHSSERRKKGVRDYVKMQKGIKTAVNKLTGKAMVPAKESIGAAAAGGAMAAKMYVDKNRDDEERRRKDRDVSPERKRADKKNLANKKQKVTYRVNRDALNQMKKEIETAKEKDRLANRPIYKKATDKLKSMFGKKTEAYMSGHGHGSGVVYGGKHDDPAFQALMKKHGVTHRLIGKSGKSAKLIGSPDNIRKVLQSEDKTTDAERAAIDAFMKKKGAKQLPPGKAQGHTGKSFSIKPMGISPDKMGLKGRGKHLDKDLVHKEGVEIVKTLVGERPKGPGWGLHRSGQQRKEPHDVWKRTTKKVAAPKFNKEDKAYGPTGIAYSVPKGHPDAVDPKTGKKKYPPHLTLDKMRAAFAKTKGGKDVKKEQTQLQLPLGGKSKYPPGKNPNSRKTQFKPKPKQLTLPLGPGSTTTNTGSASSKIAQGKTQAKNTAAANQQATTTKQTPSADKKKRRSFDSGIKRFRSWTKDKVKTHGPWVTTAAALGHALGSV
tara:strand:- start:388 stop:2385 length:1998 start_codon:yes stop_codon:yes gene_type:complete